MCQSKSGRQKGASTGTLQSWGQMLVIVSNDCISIIGSSGYVMDTDCCRGINGVGAVVIIVFVSIVACGSNIAIEGMWLGCGTGWDRIWLVMGTVMVIGVGSSGIVVDEDACRVVGIVVSCGTGAGIVIDIGRNIVVVVSVEWLVGAGCWCCWLVGFYGGCDISIEDGICIVSLSLLSSLLVVGYCEFSCWSFAPWLFLKQERQRRKHSTFWHNIQCCSIWQWDDRLPSITVVATGVIGMHWTCYAVSYMYVCTVEVVNWGGGVGVESHPNLQSLNVLWGNWEGFGLVGTGGVSALGCKGHHGGWQTCWHFYINHHRIQYQMCLHTEGSSTFQIVQLSLIILKYLLFSNNKQPNPVLNWPQDISYQLCILCTLLVGNWPWQSTIFYLQIARHMHE